MRSERESLVSVLKGRVATGTTGGKERREDVEEGEVGMETNKEDVRKVGSQVKEGQCLARGVVVGRGAGGD